MCKIDEKDLQAMEAVLKLAEQYSKRGLFDEVEVAVALNCLKNLKAQQHQKNDVKIKIGR